MGIGAENTHLQSFDRFKKDANLFFETLLQGIGLSETQIKDQNIPELEDSLVRIDDALKHPDSFGVLRLNMSANGTVFVVKSDVGSMLQLGIVPIIIERKKLVIECLRSKRSERPIQTLTELIDSIGDGGLREKLRTEYEAAKSAATGLTRLNVIKNGSAFIAMAMNPNNPMLEDVLDAIKDGALRSNVAAVRIDEAISNEPITPRMLSAPKRSL